MSIPLVDRLLFAQGGHCFFCTAPLAKGAATVEHLEARANGGGNSDGNCVACCHEMNSLLGSMSLKEKFRVVLNQRGKFVCPKHTLAKAKSIPLADRPALPTHPCLLSIVLAKLVKRGASRPKKVKGLMNAIRTDIAAAKIVLTESELGLLFDELKRTGKIVIKDTRVTYLLV